MASVVESNFASSVSAVGGVQGVWGEQFQLIRDVSVKVGKEILDLRRAGLQTKTVVLPNGKEVEQTNADIVASQQIFEMLSKAYPNYGFISQDQMGLDASWYEKDFVFLVNPIDGTKAFAGVDGSTDFHIQIGLLHKDEVVVGVSYYPATETLVWAIREEGAWIETKGEKRKLELRPCPDNVLLKSSSHGTVSPHFPDFAVMGSSFSSTTRLLHMIEGHSKLYISLGGLGEAKKGGVWNYGANSLIAKEAGLILTTLRGNPIHLRCRAALLEEGILMTGDAGLAEKVAGIFLSAPSK